MKKFYSLLILSALFLTAFSPAESMDDVIGALQNGNHRVLARYMDENVEVVLPQYRDSYSKVQAMMILKFFFSNNVVTGFDVKQKVKNGESMYCIGTLHTHTGNYRTVVFMKSKHNRQSMQEIRFQPMK